ncbi:MAG: microviridin/marinostatin family tricyclic proteinase inhibitor [Chitinophagaceae bacterium]
MNSNDQLKQPFFAKFLEKSKASEAVQLGITKPWIDVLHTDKYPSDNDEAGDPS